MSRLATLTAAAALALAVGFAGTAKAEVFFPFDTDLVAYWPFDDAGDTTPNDEAPAGAVADDGTFNFDADYESLRTNSGSLPPVAPNADSMELDGTDDYMSASGVSADLNQAGDFTIAAWVALNADGGINSIVMKEPDNTERNYGFIIWPNRVTLAVSFDAGVADGGGSGACDVGNQTCWATGGTAFVDGPNPLGTWRHIAGVYDNTAKTLKVYLDGVLDGTFTILTLGDPKLNNQDVWIGARPPFTPADDTDGLIDEVRIYDVALSDDDIATLHSSVAVFKELVSAEEIGGGDTTLDLNENWQFVMKVTVANNTTDDLTNFSVRDPLPGDLELGDETSGTVNACNEAFIGALTEGGDEPGTATAFARGGSDKCIIDWVFGSAVLNPGEVATLTIDASTDLNPRQFKKGPKEGQSFQEYTSEGINCINQGAKLTGTLDSTPVIIRSNGLQVEDGDTLPDDVAFVTHDDCGEPVFTE